MGHIVFKQGSYGTEADSWNETRPDLDKAKRKKPLGNTSVPKVTPITILVDTREQLPWHFGPSVTVERCKLDAGDYSLKGFTGRVAIERKSLDDLAQTISWGRERFEAELQLLRQYEFRAIVVEASMEDARLGRYESRTHPSAVIGSTIAFWHDCGCPTIWAGNPAHAADVVERLFRRMVEKAMFRRKDDE